MTQPSAPPSLPPSANRLAGETSPYLLQHKDNPVHWWPWGPQAFAEARATGKPVLLSVGYAACHWCHVMAHESFENAETAALMNALFVNIKVDREEHPDVDQIYMSALQQLGDHGGWPLTMFLDAEGRPFWGGTYFPPTARYGRPAFTDVLRQISAAYRNEPDKIAKNTDAILDGLRVASAPAAGESLGPQELATAAARIAARFDPVHGGLKGAPKFPQCGLLEFLWRRGLRDGRPELRAHMTHTLDRMCEGGIYDHIGGGFARYSVDQIWFVPHFEKMLSDNAQLLELLALAHLDTGAGLFARRAAETVDWLQRDMLTKEGAFAASLDADSEGHEGRFYVWSAKEITALLGAEDAAVFNRFYDVTPAGNWESGNILNRTDAGTISPEDEARLAPMRAKLAAARVRRPPPGRDHKILADWNGLTIAALARAGGALNQPTWIALAAQVFEAMLRQMTPGGRLVHSLCAGKRVGPALSSDLAAMAKAALALHEATGAPDYLAHAARFLDTLEEHHRDAASGAYFLTADDAEDLILRPLTSHDEAVPNPNGVAVDTLLRLAAVTGNEVWRTRADRILAGLAGAVAGNILAHGALLNAFDTRLGLAEVTVVGPRAPELKAAAQALPFPLRALRTATEADANGSDSLMAARLAAAPEAGAAFVCIGERCTPPITDPAAVRGTVLGLLTTNEAIR